MSVLIHLCELENGKTNESHKRFSIMLEVLIMINAILLRNQCQPCCGFQSSRGDLLSLSENIIFVKIF